MMETMETMEGTEREEMDRGTSPEAVAFMLDLGICPGSDCPLSKGGCDPQCPALVTWVEGVMNG